jgi:hypothetical protein
MAFPFIITVLLKNSTKEKDLYIALTSCVVEYCLGV